MVDGNIDIYIDSSFFSAVSGTEDILTTFVAGLNDNIGQRDMGADYATTPSISGTANTLTDVYISNSGILNDDGYVNAANKYQANTSISGLEVALVDYAIPATTSGLNRTEDFDLAYFTGLATISGAITRKVTFIGGELQNYANNFLGSYWSFADVAAENDREANYTAGGDYSDLIPGPPEDQVIISGTDDFRTYVTMGNDTNSGTIQEECELSLAGYPIEFRPYSYTYKFHLAAGTEADKQGAVWEATVISGSVLDIPFDVFSTATASGYYHFDSVSGLVDLISYSFNSNVISGTISHYYGQALCGVSGTDGYRFNIALLSLKIANFSLDIDEYTAASGTICVDITDDVYNVVTSGSYFIIDETTTSGNTYTPITDGYTMCYDSPTDFDSLVGSTTVTVHTENDNGDVLERDFYLTSGYIVEYDNRTQDYGFGSQVVVRASAENMASCPNTGVDAYYFTTLPRKSIDLGASIVGEPWSEKNLSAEIVPTTDTIYFYGKTFRIEVRAKDFAGNVMEPFTFEFKIEDKPE
jgi:hypothetical protein